MKQRELRKKRAIIEDDGEIKLPGLEYKTVVSFREDVVFNGRTLPVPLVLFEYLSGSELKVFSVILSQHREHGCCLLKTTAMAKTIGITHITIANTLSKLKKMGLIYYESSGKKRNKIIDWEAVGVLEHIGKNWKSGGMTLLRKKLKDKNVNRIVPDLYRDVKAQFEISNDPIENEEYD